ncbi:acyltransferase [Alphaproteobacteria bacterium]|nr:acyltransferase [Alphaproteobacteria bacterium]
MNKIDQLNDEDRGYHLRYRPEVDGLRAIAVVPVIAFHIGLPGFEGGFIGVDIFFVISGYLISLLIFRDIGNNTFNLVDFYQRRIKRIFPALVFVALASAVLSWFLLLPNQMIEFSRSLVATSLFLSNVLFWRETDYFATAASEKPLLHTWSLSVEEQFYLAFPLFFIGVWRFGVRGAFWILILCLLISFSLSEWGWRHKATANFYLLPTRAWELLLGSVGALYMYKSRVKANSILSIFGFSCIAFSVIWFSEDTPTPSYFTLLPTVGALLILLYTGHDSLLKKLLSSRLLVGIGLISYSLYLWHQPIFVFSKVWSGNLHTVTEMIFLVLLIFVCSFLSWRFIEQPARNKRVSSSNVFRCFGAFSVLMLSLGVLMGQNNGMQQRFEADDLDFLNQINSRNGVYVSKRFDALRLNRWSSDKTKLLVVGDSYAQDLTNGIFESKLQERFDVSTFYVSAVCGNLYLPFEELKQFISQKNISRCRRENYFLSQSFLDLATQADVIWLASSWQDWQVVVLEKSLEKLKASVNGKIFVFGRKDFPKLDVRRYLGLNVQQRKALYSPISADHVDVNVAMANLNFKDVFFVDVQNLMCGGNVFQCSLFDDDGLLKSYDGGHLTKEGAVFYGNAIYELLESNFGAISDN